MRSAGAEDPGAAPGHRREWKAGERRGGEAYFEGTRTPVAYKPFLDQLRASLGRQYLLTFEAESRGGAHDAALRVTTELPHVKIAAPGRARIPAAR